MTFNQVDVFFILAKGYLSHELGMLGFPAYDRSELLLGFYKEVQSQAGQTQVRRRGPARAAVVDDNQALGRRYTMLHLSQFGRLGSRVP